MGEEDEEKEEEIMKLFWTPCILPPPAKLSKKRRRTTSESEDSSLKPLVKFESDSKALKRDQKRMGKENNKGYHVHKGLKMLNSTFDAEEHPVCGLVSHWLQGGHQLPATNHRSRRGSRQDQQGSLHAQQHHCHC